MTKLGKQIIAALRNNESLIVGNTRVECRNHYKFVQYYGDTVAQYVPDTLTLTMRCKHVSRSTINRLNVVCEAYGVVSRWAIKDGEPTFGGVPAQGYVTACGVRTSGELM